jgi:hypothetical protein
LAVSDVDRESGAVENGATDRGAATVGASAVAAAPTQAARAAPAAKDDIGDETGLLQREGAQTKLESLHNNGSSL